MTIRRRGLGIRLVSASIDFAFGLAVGLLLTGTAGRYFAGRAAIMLRVGSPDSVWLGPIPMVLGIFGNLAYGLPFALILVLLAEMFFGAGPGKYLFRMRIARADGGAAGIGRRALRWAVKCSGLWVMALALLLGSQLLALLSLAAGCAVFAGSLLALGPERLSLHDRITDTGIHGMS